MKWSPLASSKFLKIKSGCGGGDGGGGGGRRSWVAGFYTILLYSGDKVESSVHFKRSSLLFNFKVIQKIHGRQNAKI